MDFVILTPQELRKRSRRFDPFLREVLRKGKLLYQAAP